MGRLVSAAKRLVEYLVRARKWLVTYYGFDLPRAPKLQASRANLPVKRKYFDKTRTEAFSDGIFAVALTLLIVDLSTAGLPHTFSDQKWDEFWPKWRAWLYGTASVGMFWVAHHNEMEHVESLDRIMLWINLLFLCLIALFPFSAVMLGVYWHAAEQLGPEVVSDLFRWALTRTPVVVYGGNLVMAGLVLGTLWRYARQADAYGRPRFLKYDRDSDDEISRTDGRNKLIPQLGFIVIGVGVVYPELGQWLIIIVPGVYILASICYAVLAPRWITPLGIIGRKVPLWRRVERSRETGVRVQSLAPDGAARAAGMLKGDIIVAVDGTLVGDIDELHRLIPKQGVVGKSAEITFLRVRKSSRAP
jgi:uncharacterized membrane protein